MKLNLNLIMKLRNIQILIFLITISTCFGQDELKKLENAYKQKSQSLLSQFLEQWRSESIPITSLDSLNNLQKDVYEIF